MGLYEYMYQAIKESGLEHRGHFEDLRRKKCSIKSNTNPIFLLLFITSLQ